MRSCSGYMLSNPDGLSFYVALALLFPPLLLLPLGTPALLAAVPVPLTALAGLRLSRRAFGGIGGDVVGATGEAARSALLVVLSATI